MKEKIITKELAKLYEKQGYLEDSLTCYLTLFKQTNKQEFADAIENIKKKINTAEKTVGDERPADEKSADQRSADQSSIDIKKAGFWKKPSDFKSDSKSDFEKKDDKNTRMLSLFEQWVSMIVLEKKIQNFKKIPVK